MQNLEAACRRILGQAKLETFQQLSPSQIIEACTMLDEGWPPEVVEMAVDILQRYRWFRIIGITVPPWGLEFHYLERLVIAAPWDTDKIHGSVVEHE